MRLFLFILLNLSFGLPAAWANPEPETECVELLTPAQKLLWKQLWETLSGQDPELSPAALMDLLGEAGPFSVPKQWQDHWRVAPIREALAVTQSFLSAAQIAETERQFAQWLKDQLPVAQTGRTIAQRLSLRAQVALRPETMMPYVRHIGRTRFMPSGADWISIFVEERGAWVSQLTDLTQLPSALPQNPDFGAAKRSGSFRWFEPMLGMLKPSLSKSFEGTQAASVSLDLRRAVSYGESGHSPVLWDLEAKPARPRFLPLVTAKGERGVELVTAEISPDGKWVAVLTGAPHDRSKLRQWIPKNLTLRIWDVNAAGYLPSQAPLTLPSVVYEGLALRFTGTLLQWSPDSQHIIAMARDHSRGDGEYEKTRPKIFGAWLISVPELTLKSHFSSQTGGVASSAFSSDGESLLLATETPSSDLELQHIDLKSSTAAKWNYSPQVPASFAVGKLNHEPIVFAVAPDGAVWMSNGSDWARLYSGFPERGGPFLWPELVTEVHWVESSCELFAEFPLRGWIRWDLNFLNPENCSPNR